MLTLSKRTKDETGNRYGHLFVLEFVGLRSRLALWKCLCSCGKEHTVRGSNLRSGNTRSCGCSKDYSSRTLPNGVAASNALWRSYIQQAEKRGHKFNLSQEEFRSITSQNCYYCDTEPKQIKSGITYNGDYVYNGIDRVDNNIGYIIKNVVPCCGYCNTRKGDMSATEIINMAKKIKDYLDE